MIVHQNVDLPSIVAQLEMELRMAIALRRSKRLRLHVLKGRSAILLACSRNSAWMCVTPDALSVTRERPFVSPGDAEQPLFDLVSDTRWETEPDSAKTLIKAWERARRIVSELLKPGRWNYLPLEEWAPVIEVSLYAVAARIASDLDAMRPSVLKACRESRHDAEGLAVGYRTMVEVLGRATLVALNGGGRWLADVSSGLVGTRWTPSYDLSRERDVRSISIAARAASRFGPAMIERYVEILRTAKKQAQVWDALIGLAAIGAYLAAEREPVIRLLEREVQRIEAYDAAVRGAVKSGIYQAILLLREDPSTYRIFADRHRDPFSSDQSGRLIAFQSIGPAVRTTATTLVRAWNSAGMEPPHLAEKLLSRAWAEDRPSLDLNSFPDHAFGTA